MPIDVGEFLNAIADIECSNAERAVALLWLYSTDDPNAARTARQLAEELEQNGYPRQNVTRLKQAIEKDPRTAKASSNSFRIRVTSRAQLEQTYGKLLQSRPIRRSNSVLPLDLFVGTRPYIERVVLQINASYDNSLFDCCAVMCRRLLETLIIEAYEAHKRADELKGADGQFMMFSGLLAHLESDKAFNVGRSSMQALRDFKKLGDLSAHNRRFNARQDDIDRVRDGSRIASEELLQLAGLVK